MLAMGRYALMFALSMSFIASCTNANKTNRIQRVRANGGDKNAGTGDSSNLPKTGNANLTVSFDNSKFGSFNMSTVTYKFLFLGASAQGPVVFTNNVANIVLSNLPSNVSDDIRLEIYENNQFQMVGRAPKVTLKAGNNTVQITDFTAENVELNGAWDGKSFQGNAAWKIEGN